MRSIAKDRLAHGLVVYFVVALCSELDGTSFEPNGPPHGSPKEHYCLSWCVISAAYAFTPIPIGGNAIIEATLRWDVNNLHGRCP